MGEQATNVFVTGAPGLDGISDAVLIPRIELLRGLGLDASRSVALLIYHPVLQSADAAGDEMNCVLEAALSACAQVVCMTPNSDAGAHNIRKAIAAHSSNKGLKIATHFPRLKYLSLVAAADVMLGNSSSGIIEAASFGTAVINIGERQSGRERNANVTDVPVDRDAIRLAIVAALAAGRFTRRNIYGDGHAGEKIVELLSTLPLTNHLLRKTNAN
jgi:GDP/UDP-N,N'-diacetylbacillosamine 2-epimerase (hydrolysing)